MCKNVSKKFVGPEGGQRPFSKCVKKLVFLLGSFSLLQGLSLFKKALVRVRLLFFCSLLNILCPLQTILCPLQMIDLSGTQSLETLPLQMGKYSLLRYELFV